MNKITVPFWKPTLEYPVAAVLTSRFRDSLDRISDNPKGKTNLSYFLVVLYPDNNNEHDSNAVAVMTQHSPAKVLGYLPREIAAQYRKRMQEAGYDHNVSACEAVLSGGLVAPDRTYDYILEVDLDMSVDPSSEHLMVNPELAQRPSDPEFKKDADGDYRFKCWLPHDAVGYLHPKLNAHGWTTDAWTTINYYIKNSKGIGLGFKVLTVSKDKHSAVFGEFPVEVVIEGIKRRWVTLRLEKPA